MVLVVLLDCLLNKGDFVRCNKDDDDEQFLFTFLVAAAAALLLFKVEEQTEAVVSLTILLRLVDLPTAWRRLDCEVCRCCEDDNEEVADNEEAVRRAGVSAPVVAVLPVILLRL